MTEIIGNCKKIAQLNNDIVLIAETLTSLLLTGETGTGKTTIAANIHKLSKRTGEFVTVSYLNDNFIESDLFGHKKGSFTGAMDNRCGALKMAEGGTLFIDEIGDLPLSVQVKLLHLLDTGEYSPLGSDEIIKADVRFIFATHVDLQKKVKEGKFREDLFYRINIIELKVPALRERDEDVFLWIDMLFEKACTENSTKIPVDLKNEFLEKFKDYSWPGNLRELYNSIQKAVVINRVHDSSNPQFTYNTLSQDTNINESSDGDNQLSETEISLDVLIQYYFNHKKTLSEMTEQLENDYMLAVNNLSSEEAIDLLGVKKFYYKKYFSLHEVLMDEKVKITLNQKTRLRDILNHFKMKVYEEMSRIFPSVRKSQIMKKLEEKESAYNNRKRILKEEPDSEIYFGHALLTTEKINKPQEILPTANKTSNISEIKSLQTPSFHPLQNQINMFFEHYKLMETELKTLREKNKDLEDALMAVRRAITVI
ncbi:MAG: sigma 54-interacting transcriptional regulator [Candidatus Magasanikbacteria bacterium]|nr:sigma 54-interacting transcriptional regulator [Candidatus Magasanikbacteria bacterium]